MAKVNAVVVKALPKELAATAWYFAFEVFYLFVLVLVAHLQGHTELVYFKWTIASLVLFLFLIASLTLARSVSNSFSILFYLKNGF